MRDLILTIKERYFVGANQLSKALVILGVCYEMIGDRDIAYQCYDEAMGREDNFCKIAELRKSRLFNNSDANK